MIAKTKLLEKNFQENLNLKSKLTQLTEELRKFDGIVSAYRHQQPIDNLSFIRMLLRSKLVSSSLKHAKQHYIMLL